MRRAMMVVLVQVAACGCGTRPPGTACTAPYAYGVSVTLTDATTGAPISNATLALTEGTYVETMQFMPGGDYVGAGER